MGILTCSLRTPAVGALIACVLTALSPIAVADQVPPDLARLVVVPPDGGRATYFAEPGRRTIIYFRTVPRQQRACPSNRADSNGVWIVDFGADIAAASAEYSEQRNALNDSVLQRDAAPWPDVDEGETVEVAPAAAEGTFACRKYRRETLFRIDGTVVFVTQDHYGAFDDKLGIAARIRTLLREAKPPSKLAPSPGPTRQPT